MKERLLKCIATGFIVLIAFTAIAQSDKLQIGDEAPEIRYSKWIKGNEFQNFDPAQVYVMEFWATWCGPCKQAMPHLTELQKQYEGKVTFVGVNVWEKISKDKAYETVVPDVEKFVKGNDANMGYTVIVDDNDQYMGNKWLKAAGQYGIPASFIVKGNRIVWLGHPQGLDDVIPKVLDGSFDAKAFKEEADQKAQREKEFMEARMALINPIQEALQAKEYQKAFKLMDDLIAEKPEYKSMMDITRFKMLLTEVSEEQALEFAQSNKEINPSLILGEVYKVEGLSPKTYIWAAENFGSTEAVTNPLIFDALATCYAKGGDYAKAVINQQKALEIAEKALANGEMVGTIMDYTVEEYRNKLAEYKKAK